MSIKINVTQGDYRKRKPEKTTGNPKKNLTAAMQIAALNKIVFSPEDEESMKGIDFFGYISGKEHEIEFWFFENPEIKKGNLEMKYIRGRGDLAAFTMAGGSQLMFAARNGKEEKFRIAAKAKMDGREISFRDSKAQEGSITLAFTEGDPAEMELHK